jgi:trimeric autotransporter adhesin
MRKFCFVVMLAAGCSKLLGVDDVQRRDAGVFSTLAQEAYIKASNTGAGDRFGAVALSADGSVLAVAAFAEASAATGTDGNQLDDSQPGAGAVYVFTRDDTRWIQQAYLKASNTGEGDNFGSRIALSADGLTLAVSAVGEDSSATGVGGNQSDNSFNTSGAVYVFTRSGATWFQQAYIKASNTGIGDLFGGSIALSADGSTLAVGASEDSAATGINGDQSDNSASGAGAVYVFTRSGMSWSQQAYIKASNTDKMDAFGRSIALSADGSTLVVGASGEDSAATGIDGNQSDNSASSAGAVYVFTRSGTTWSQQSYIKASNTDADDIFGFSIGLSADGSTLAVGAAGEASAATGINGNQADNSAEYVGAVYVYLRNGTAWSQQAYIKAANADPRDAFGAIVALSSDGSILAVGAGNESSAATGVGGNHANNTAPGAGAVYLFTRNGMEWRQSAYVKASNTSAGDAFGANVFGASVALSGDGLTLAVGAAGEDSAATGIDGNQDDNAAEDSGAVYVFR